MELGAKRIQTIGDKYGMLAPERLCRGRSLKPTCKIYVHVSMKALYANEVEEDASVVESRGKSERRCQKPLSFHIDL